MNPRSVALTIVLALLAVGCSSDAPETAAPSTVAEAATDTAPSSTTAAPTTEDTTTTQSPAAVSPSGSIGFDEWTAFRGGPDRRAFDGNAEGSNAPELLWQRATGGIVESSPAVVNGLVIGGTFDNALYALDASTGEEVWRFQTGGLVRSSPAVVDGVAYFCLLYTSPSPRDQRGSRMPSSA